MTTAGPLVWIANDAAGLAHAVEGRRLVALCGAPFYRDPRTKRADPVPLPVMPGPWRSGRPSTPTRRPAGDHTRGCP